MLTIQVNDAQLEAQLIQQAKATGKPAQQLAEELLANALVQLASTPFSFRTLDPKQHSHPLQFDVDPTTDDAPALGHVDDTTTFSTTLRQNAWKR